MIKDLLGSTESSSVGDTSTFGFSAEVFFKTENFVCRLATQNPLRFRWNAVSITVVTLD